MPSYFLWILIVFGIAFTVKTRRLTWAGAITGGAVGLLVFEGMGYAGFLQMVVFFLLGTMATSWKRTLKTSIKVSADQSSRTARQVLANAGGAGFLALLAVICPQYQPLLLVMLSATFASATADTLSSELGTVYGRRFINILTLQKDHRGADGVISLEGTLFGLVGSVSIACIYILFEGWNMNVFRIILAGTAGNFFDSFLGAWLERKSRIGNDAVNFLNTLFAALVALVFSL